MIVYSTLLQTSEKLTRDAFLKVMLANSSKFHSQQLISSLPETGIREVFSSTAGKTFIIATNQSRGLTAVRYVKPDTCGHLLFHEYILNEHKMSLYIKSGVHNYMSKPDYTLFQKCLPGLAHRLIAGHFLADDSFFPVTGDPIVINDENEWQLAKLLDQSSSIKINLPVVFITPSVFGKYPVAIGEITFRLAGFSHIVVLKDEKALNTLKEIGLHPSPLHGSVFIYNKERGANEIISVFLSGKPTHRYEKLLQSVLTEKNKHPITNVPSYEDVANTILQEQILHCKKAYQKAQCSQKLIEQKYNYLVTHLEEERQRLEKEATEKALQEAEQIVNSYEADIEKLQNELYEKNMSLQGTETENQRLRSHLDKDRIPVIYFGTEKEFYLGEIQDLLLSTLEDALEDIPEQSRKRDVITDILASNNYMHISKDRNEQVKHLLKGYNGMTVKVRHSLEKLGFTVEETKKHCKISYHGDKRYLVVFGSTPSDVRSGMNNATKLARIAY